MSLFTKLGQDVFRGYDAAGVARQPDTQDAVVWSTEVERLVNAFTSNGGLIYASKAAMDADLAHGSGQMAWVLGDATAANNGIYQKTGASGAGSWVRRGDLPYSFILATNGGAGTANAIQATTPVPVPAANGGALIVLPIIATNTGTPVTVSFNGSSALTVKTNSGADIEVGKLKAGMMLAGLKSGSTFRLLSDQLENMVWRGTWATATAYSRNEAVKLNGTSFICILGHVSGAATQPGVGASWTVNWDILAQKGDAGVGETMPAVASTFVRRNVANTSYNPITVHETMSALGIPITQAEAMATTFVDAPDSIRTAGYATVGDGGGAPYKKSFSEPTHAGKFQSADGLWWELSASYVVPEMFGALCDGEADDAVAINIAWAYVTQKGSIGARLDFTPGKVYYYGSSIQIGPIDSKQRIFEGNDCFFEPLPGYSGYMFDSNNVSGIWAWRVEFRNFTANGIYGSSAVNFIRAVHCNGLKFENVFAQSFNIGVNLNNSFAVKIEGVTFRYIKQHVVFASTATMQLKLIDVRAYDTNSGVGIAANPAIYLFATNANIILDGCDFEGGKGNFLYTQVGTVISQISITNSYVEGFDQSPLLFDGTVGALVFEGNWLGYNAGTQIWRNITSGRISGNVFANQITSVETTNGNVSTGNNQFIDGANRFYFPQVSATMASGATALDAPGWKIDANGFVHLNGKLSRAASGDLLTLPVGARPQVNFQTLVPVDGTFNLARVQVNTSGVVTVTYNSGGGAIYLSGISFCAGG